MIRKCGSEEDPKAFALGMSSELHALGQTAEATRWAEIATAIEAILDDIPDPGSIPRSIQ